MPVVRLKGWVSGEVPLAISPDEAVFHLPKSDRSIVIDRRPAHAFLAEYSRNAITRVGFANGRGNPNIFGFGRKPPRQRVSHRVPPGNPHLLGMADFYQARFGGRPQSVSRRCSRQSAHEVNANWQ